MKIAYYDQWYYHDKLLNLVRTKSLFATDGCQSKSSAFFHCPFPLSAIEAGEETSLGSSLVVIKSKDKQDALKAFNLASACQKTKKCERK